MLSWASGNPMNSPAAPGTMRKYSVMPPVVYKFTLHVVRDGWLLDGCMRLLRLISTHTSHRHFSYSWVDNWNVDTVYTFLSFTGTFCPQIANPCEFLLTCNSECQSRWRGSLRSTNKSAHFASVFSSPKTTEPSSGWYQGGKEDKDND